MFDFMEVYRTQQLINSITHGTCTEIDHIIDYIAGVSKF